MNGDSALQIRRQVIRLCLVILAAAVTFASPIHGSERLVRHEKAWSERPAMGAPDAVIENVITAPETQATMPVEQGPFQARQLPPRDGDKGSFYTNTSEGRPAATLNALELAKLELGRRAIEAAEALGTRTVAPKDHSGAADETAAAEAAMKLEMLRALLPAERTGIPGAPVMEEVR